MNQLSKPLGTVERAEDVKDRIQGFNLSVAGEIVTLGPRELAKTPQSIR